MALHGCRYYCEGEASEGGGNLADADDRETDTQNFTPAPSRDSPFNLLRLTHDFALFNPVELAPIGPFSLTR